MTSRPPPRTRSTRSRCSVSTSRNSMSAQPSRTNARMEHATAPCQRHDGAGDSPVPSLPAPRERACGTTPPHHSQELVGSGPSRGAGEAHPHWCHAACRSLPAPLPRAVAVTHAGATSCGPTAHPTRVTSAGWCQRQLSDPARAGRCRGFQAQALDLRPNTRLQHPCSALREGYSSHPLSGCGEALACSAGPAWRPGTSSQSPH